MTGEEKREIWRPQFCSHSFSCLSVDKIMTVGETDNQDQTGHKDP